MLRNTRFVGRWMSGGLLLGVTLGLAACGPIYETRYSFTPPPTPEGRVCLLQCDQIRLQCRQFEDMKKENCEQQNRWEREHYERCKNAGRKDCRYPSTYCSTNYDRCEEQYRICFQTCGGRVDATTVCVANCEQIPPPPVVVQPQGGYPPPPPPPPPAP